MEEILVKTEYIDFDHWAWLAKSDSVLFEKERVRIIEEVIQSASEHQQERLHHLQWRIDMERVIKIS